MAEWNWIQVDTKLAAHLKTARLAAHWAAQIPASLSSLLDAEADYSHTNLLWNPTHHALQSRPVTTQDGRSIRAGLRLGSLSISVASGGVVEDEYLLRSRTLQSGQQWLIDVLEDRGLVGDLTRPQHDLPQAPAGDGVAFEADGTALAALEAWVSNAALVLEPFAKDIGAGELRGWPHHFDLAALKELTPGAMGEGAPSINVGFSPGDDSFDCPYFYVTPWPRPAAGVALPALPPQGKWHTEGFFAAVLLGTDLPADAAAQQATVDAFLKGAVEAAHVLATTSA